MKFTVEIELDYIDEDGNLDEAIKEELLHKLSKGIIDKSSSKVNDLADIAATQLNQNINIKIKELFNGFMEKSIAISKGWNKVVEYGSVNEYLEQSFEQAIKVYFNSKEYSEGCPFEKYMQERIKNESSKLISDIKADLDKKSKIIASQAIADNATIQTLQNLLTAAQK